MKNLLSVSFIFAALITSVPRAAQSQSKTDCAPQPRNELVLTVVDKNGSVIENLRVIGYCGELKAKLQLEVADPEIRKSRPVLAL